MSDENIFLFYSIYTGVYITFLYDIIRVFRRTFSHSSLMVSLEDMAFWIYCGGRVFVLMYRYSDGMLRWFAVLGALVGMSFYLKFISSFFVKYTSDLLIKIKKTIQKAVKHMLYPLKRKFFRIKKKLTLAIKMLKMSIIRLHNSKAHQKADKTNKKQRHNRKPDKKKISKINKKPNGEYHGKKQSCVP
jgi:spore cortex biosynthesis protein YabQ